ncbi:hypothetical protein Syun_007946 [Stephania yunnanensis]|uniref:Dynein light chain 1, cytoplasmic n=1 Tax=Stephania yunnanensis TaxID=152371 RepID=A0AAP0PZR8_9MAGN
MTTTMEETKRSTTTTANNNNGAANLFSSSDDNNKNNKRSPSAAAPSAAPKKVVIKSADMKDDMQNQAIDCALYAFDKYSVEKEIAEHIKKEFDKKHGPTWHCIVGRNFGPRPPAYHTTNLEVEGEMVQLLRIEPIASSLVRVLRPSSKPQLAPIEARTRPLTEVTTFCPGELPTWRSYPLYLVVLWSDCAVGFCEQNFNLENMAVLAVPLSCESADVHCRSSRPLMLCNYCFIFLISQFKAFTYLLCSYVTHETNHFVYFYLDQKAILLFKSG